MPGIKPLSLPLTKIAQSQASLAPTATVQKTFGEFLNNQIDGLVNQAHMVEQRVHNYAMGEESIETVAPTVTEFTLTVEALAKIVASLTEALKSLMQTPM